MIDSKLRQLSQPGSVGKFIADYDWNSTSIGDPGCWPPSLLVILNYMLESKVPMILSWGEDFIQFYNDAFIPFLGDKHPYAIGKKAEEIWKEIAEESLEYLKVVSSGKPVFFEERPWTIVLNGIPEVRYLTTNTLPIRLEDGTVGGVFNTLIDVTESRKLQIELKSAVEDRDRFLSIASHELKTPMTSIKLHTQMMQRLGVQGLSQETLEKFFRQTDLQISRLSRLVDDLLDVSRIRQGKISCHLEIADLAPVLSEIVERLNIYYLQSDMVVPDVKFDGQDFVCKIDLNRFEQIVNNLLTNAFKYGEGGPVYVVLADLGDKISLTVLDSGPGIPPEEQEQIFKQYNRGTASFGNGLGLGLFITRQLVETLGGTITVQNAPGKGASFKVELPKVRI